MCGTPRLLACSGLVRLVGALRVRERSRTGRHLGPQCRILLIHSSTGRWLEWCKRWFNQTVATASPYVLSNPLTLAGDFVFLRFSWSSLNGRYRSSSRANFRVNACGFFERTGQWADWTDCHSEEVRVLRDLAARLSRVPKRVFCRFSSSRAC